MTTECVTRPVAISLTLSIILSIFGVSYSRNVNAGEEPLLAHQVFTPYIHPDFLQAEQVWVAKAPRTSAIHLMKVLTAPLSRIFAPSEMEGMMQRTGDLPQEYTPEMQRVFDLPIYYVDPELMYEIGERPFAADLAVWTVHPYTLEGTHAQASEIRTWITQHNDRITPLPFQVQVTPTASNRSLFALYPAPDGHKDWSIFKTSSHLWSSGSRRTISKTQAVRAVIVSKIYQEYFTKTNGVLPLSKVAWSFFPETYASLPKDLDHLGMIHRSQPLNLPAHMIPIAAYSVNVREENGRKWIDNVLGDLDKQTFREETWKIFIRPAWELLLTMAFVYGAAPELHGQNLHYLKNMYSGKVEGVAYLDASAHISKELRLANGLGIDWNLPRWVNEKDLGFHQSAAEIEGAITYFDKYLLNNVFSLRLDSEDLQWINQQQLSFLRKFLEYYQDILGPLDVTSKKHFTADIVNRIKKHEEITAEMFHAQVIHPPKIEERHAKNVSSFHREQSIVAESRALTNGEISLYPHPVVLTEEELALLQAASAQKLKTLMAFIEDVRSGQHTWQKVIPPAVLRSLNGGRDLNATNLPKYFPYAGIDFVRNAKNKKFQTLEVQLNPIPAGTYYLDLMLNLLRRFDDSLDPTKKLGLFSLISSRCAPVNHGTSVQPTIVLLDYNVVGMANSFSKEMEVNNILQKRNADLMKQYGIYLVTVDHFDMAQKAFEKCTGICLNTINNKANFIYADGTSTRLLAHDGKLLLEILYGNKVIETRLVDYVWNHIDPNHLGDLAPEVKILIESGKISSNYHPMLTLLANKGFQAYLDLLTKLYLNEDPLVPSPQTDLFIDSNGHFNEGKLTEVRARPAGYYFKPTVGFGGQGVFAGDQHIVQSDGFAYLLHKIRTDPHRVIAQKAISQISEVPASAVNPVPLQMEIRFFAIASPTGDIATTAVALNRLARSGSKLNNLGRHVFSKLPNMAISVASARNRGVQQLLSALHSGHVPVTLRAPHASFKSQTLPSRYLETAAVDKLASDHPLHLLLAERPDLNDPLSRQEIVEEMRYSNRNTLALNPIPLTLEAQTYSDLQRSSQQRSRAMLLFLRDYFSQGKKWKTVIPESIMTYILQKTPLDEDAISPQDLAFINGVDFLRDSTGQFFVLEDNLVAAAGLYTNLQILNEMRTLAPDWSAKHLSNIDDLKIIKEHYAIVSGKDNPFIVTLHYDVDMVSALGFSDFADRVAQNQRFFGPLLRANGIEIVTISAAEREINRLSQDYLGINLFSGDSTTGLTFGERNRLTQHADGSIWLETRSGNDAFLSKPAQKVDVIISGLTPRHLRRWLGPLLQAHKSQQVMLSHTCGIELLDNKLAQIFVNKMIEVYLGEQPIFPSPKSIIFVDANGELNTQKLRFVFDHLDKWYLKESVNFEGGGSGIFPGSDLVASPALKERVLQALRSDPFSFIAVRKVAGSVTWGLGGEVARQVDFRATTLVNNDHSTPLRSLYSRGAPLSQGKLNSTGQNKQGTHQLVISLQALQSAKESCVTKVGKLFRQIE